MPLLVGLMVNHQKSESERFKGPAKWCQYVFARVLVCFLQRLPIRFAYRLGRAVGWLCWKLMPRRRAIVRKNLEIVNAWMKGREVCPQASANAAVAPDAASRSELAPARSNQASNVTNDPSLSASPCTENSSSAFIHHSLLTLEAQVREVFFRAGANLFSGFTFNRMSPEQAALHIQIEGLQTLRSALAEGKGAIVLLAHMGPWEALAQIPELAQREGIAAPFGAMYRPLNNNYLDEWYRSQREGQGTRLFSRRDGFHKPVDFLRAGGMLGILSDQKMREGVEVSFFGQAAKTTPIPGLFQRRSGAPVLAVSIRSCGTCLWSIRLRSVILQQYDDPKDRKPFARTLNAALEEMLSDSLCDGFWMQQRFG